MSVEKITELVSFYVKGKYWRARLSRNDGVSWIWTFWVIGIGLSSSLFLWSLIFNGFKKDVALISLLSIMIGLIGGYVFSPMARRIHKQRIKEHDQILFETEAGQNKSQALNIAEIYLSYGRKKKAIEVLELELISNPNDLKVRSRLEQIKYH